MYALITHFSNNNAKPQTGGASEIDVRTYLTKDDAIRAMVEISHDDHEDLDTDEHPAELTIDAAKGYAHLRIDYPGISEYIDYEIHELRHADNARLPTKTNDDGLKPYNVSIAVDARANITVMAKDPQHAKELAEDEFMEFQCGDLDIISTSPVNCTDSNDEVTDY